MLYRKAELFIHEHLTSQSDKILIVTGARQVGKSYIIRHTAKQIFKNYIEIDLIKDFQNEKLFEKVNSTDDLYMTLGSMAGSKLGSYDDTLVFLDEIQQYPQLLTLLKFIRQDRRYHFIASGSLLGITLKATTSIPIGSIVIKKMYPLDLEEFMLANDVGRDVLDYAKDCFRQRKPLTESVHERFMHLFKRYLIVGGMPDAVNEYLATKNISKIRQIQDDIHRLYGLDASQYDTDHRLHITRIYDMIPSNMENKKKRLIFKDIEGKAGKRHINYIDEIDYLIASGIAIEVKAVSNPSFPLSESGRKNLLKLYMNDVGMLTNILYRNNFRAIIDDKCGINLGAVYENAAAMELIAHNDSIFYYDNKAKGEVDFLFDDFSTLEAAPIEIKSGKDYSVHSALSRLIDNHDYRISVGYVMSNEREISIKNNIVYMPVYNIMWFDGNSDSSEIIS